MLDKINPNRRAELERHSLLSQLEKANEYWATFLAQRSAIDLFYEKHPDIDEQRMLDLLGDVINGNFTLRDIVSLYYSRHPKDAADG